MERAILFILLILLILDMTTKVVSGHPG